MNGKAYKTFIEQQSKIMKTWILPVNGAMFRIVLEKDTLDIWVNGKKAEVAGEFTDEGKDRMSNPRKPGPYIGGTETYILRMLTFLELIRGILRGQVMWDRGLLAIFSKQFLPSFLGEAYSYLWFQ